MLAIRIVALGCALTALVACGKKEDDAPAVPEPPAADSVAALALPADAPSPAHAAGDAAVVPADAAPTAATTDDATTPPVAAEPEDDGAPKNLKVLPRSWSRKQVVAYMKKELNRGLGVKCKFCHDPDDYAADTEHKSVALEMLKMTEDVNKRFFKGKREVTCFTCHLGNEEPPK